MNPFVLSLIVLGVICLLILIGCLYESDRGRHLTVSGLMIAVVVMSALGFNLGMVSGWSGISSCRTATDWQVGLYRNEPYTTMSRVKVNETEWLNIVKDTNDRNHCVLTREESPARFIVKGGQMKSL